jgi:hypothetical protein
MHLRDELLSKNTFSFHALKTETVQNVTACDIPAKILHMYMYMI